MVQDVHAWMKSLLYQAVCCCQGVTGDVHQKYGGPLAAICCWYVPTAIHRSTVSEC